MKTHTLPQPTSSPSASSTPLGWQPPSRARPPSPALPAYRREKFLTPSRTQPRARNKLLRSQRALQSPVWPTYQREGPKRRARTAQVPRARDETNFANLILSFAREAATSLVAPNLFVCTLPTSSQNRRSPSVPHRRVPA